MYWAIPRRSTVEVLRKTVADFSSLTPAALDRLRQSQILASDPPVKVLKEAGDWRLIQMADLTRGWVGADFLEKKLPSENYWAKVRRFGAEPVPVKLSAAEFLDTLKNWPAPKYVWGGRQADGLDCSGLVQAVFLQTTGYWLPKHSKDQAALGQPVSSSWALGDLVLMKNKETAVSHIGIVTDPARKIIWHHSRQNGRPRFESMPDLSRSYKFLSVNRLLAFALV